MKYHKSIDNSHINWTKCCYLSLCFSHCLLHVTCAKLRFLRLPQRESFFNSLTQYSVKLRKLRYRWSFVPCIVLFSEDLKTVFSRLSQARHHCLRKKTCSWKLQFTLLYVFNYRTSIQISLFYKFFCTNLFGVEIDILKVHLHYNFLTIF